VNRLGQGGALLLVAAIAPRGEQLAWGMLDDVVRISERTGAGSTGEQGFGFVVGRRGKDFFVVTADHVVRDDSGKPYGDVLVTFHIDQGTPEPAVLLDLRLPQTHGDLAILKVHRPSSYDPVWPNAASTDNLSMGVKAWRIGKQERWIPSAAPGQFVGLQGAIWLGFDNLDTPPGSSGGPVVTSSGIIGMVVADGGQSGSPDAVLPIGTIEMQIKQWNLPWDLLAPVQLAPSPRAPIPPSQGQIPAESVIPPRPNASPSRDEVAIEASARSFVFDYYSKMSADWSVVKPFLSTLIADPVIFYGRRTSRADYLKQQSQYFARWPQRTFLPQAGQLAVQCDAVARTCQISDRINYEVQNTASRRRSVGSETAFLRLRQEQAGFSIIEQGNSSGATP
jgi:hypothetical protein